MPETLWAAAETVRGGGLVALVLPDDCGLFGGAAELTGGGGGVCPAARHSLFPRLVQALHAGGCLVDAQLRLLRPFSPPTRKLQTREFVAGGGVPASTMELQEVADVEAKEAEALLQGGDAKVRGCLLCGAVRLMSSAGEPHFFIKKFQRRQSQSHSQHSSDRCGLCMSPKCQQLTW